jgi:putative redox protein
MIKKALLVQIKGNTFAAKAGSNHWVITDTAEKLGGHAGGSTPKELLLIALAGCTSSDVVSILRKKRAHLRHFEVQITAKESEEYPKVFTDIHLEYNFFGNGIKESDVERAIDLSSTKYCSVSAMLKATVHITYSYTINP